MFTIDSDGDGYLDDGEDGIEPIGVHVVLRPQRRDAAIGARLLYAIERAWSYEITCVACRNRLMAFSESSLRTEDDIVDYILADFQWPMAIRDQLDVKERRAWMVLIVEQVLTQNTKALGPS